MPYKVNRKWIPNLEGEGVFEKPLPTPPDQSSRWYKSVSTSERVFLHHTLSSARHSARLRNYNGLVPNDKLDLALSSTYNHVNELFPDPVDVLLQPETRGIETWRRLRNTKDEQLHLDARFASIAEVASKRGTSTTTSKPISIQRYFPDHPLIAGGMQEAIHPSYVKLMNSSHHSPQSLRGYSRQERDGSYYYY